MSRATQGEQDNYEMHVRAANIVSHQVPGPVRAPALGVPVWSPGRGAVRGSVRGGQGTGLARPVARRAVPRKGRLFLVDEKVPWIR